MKFFITLSLVLACVFTSAQTKSRIFFGEIYSDPKTTDTIKTTYYDGLLPPISSSEHKIEIRFFVMPSFDHDSVYIITYDSEWCISKIKYDHSSKKFVTIDFKSSETLEKTMNSLAICNIYSLPDQKQNHPLEYYLETDGDICATGLTVTDGETYKVQFIIDHTYSRTYEYDNPNDYASLYKNNYSLKQMTEIVKLFKKLDKNLKTM